MQEQLTYTHTELIDGLHNSSEVHYRHIFEMYWQALYELAFRKTRSTETAEELVQDVFLMLWQTREHVVIDNFESYLKVCLTRKYIDHIRKNIVHEKYWDYYKAYRPDYTATADEAILYSELNEAVRTGIASLPEKTRKVLILKKYVGLSAKEIATRIKLSEKSVEYHLAKSIKSLRLHLKDFVLLVSVFFI